MSLKTSWITQEIKNKIKEFLSSIKINKEIYDTIR